jgi:SET domain
VSRTEQLYAWFCRSISNQHERYGGKAAVVVPRAVWLLGTCNVELNPGHREDGAIMTTQNSSSSDTVLGYGRVPVRDQANPERGVLQMRLPMGTRSAKLDVAMANGRKGLFALASIDRNEILIDLNGENSFLSPTRRSLQIGERKHVFGREETVGYLNHGCEPNCFLDFGCVCVRALRNIQAREEVKVNYAATEYEMHDSFRCDCGSSVCLGRIRGFKFLTRDQQLELKPYLAPYLLKKLDEEVSQSRNLVEK